MTVTDFSTIEKRRKCLPSDEVKHALSNIEYVIKFTSENNMYIYTFFFKEKLKRKRVVTK